MVEKKRILAVDDEEDILEILSFNLAGDGYDVDTCHLRRGGSTQKPRLL